MQEHGQADHFIYEWEQINTHIHTHLHSPPREAELECILDEAVTAWTDHESGFGLNTAIKNHVRCHTTCVQSHLHYRKHKLHIQPLLSSLNTYALQIRAYLMPIDRSCNYFTLSPTLAANRIAELFDKEQCRDKVLLLLICLSDYTIAQLNSVLSQLYHVTHQNTVVYLVQLALLCTFIIFLSCIPCCYIVVLHHSTWRNNISLQCTHVLESNVNKMHLTCL